MYNAWTPNDDKRKQEPNQTDDFKAQVAEATQRAAEQIAFWKEYWSVWMPGGLRKRKRYRTKSQGQRRAERRKKNKIARASRKRNRRPKKGRK